MAAAKVSTSELTVVDSFDQCARGAVVQVELNMKVNLFQSVKSPSPAPKFSYWPGIGAASKERLGDEGTGRGFRQAVATVINIEDTTKVHHTALLYHQCCERTWSRDI